MVLTMKSSMIRRPIYLFFSNILLKFSFIKLQHEDTLETEEEVESI